MRRAYAIVVCLGLASIASANPGINAFTDWCFKAGQTAEDARSNMEGDFGAPLPFDLIFWDRSLGDEGDGAPQAERRCEVVFDGDFTEQAVLDVMLKMMEPPVFGTPIPLTPPYEYGPGVFWIEARELLRQRVAVVEIGLHPGQRTYIRVDRLYAGAGLPS